MSTPTDALAEFVLARIDEAEARFLAECEATRRTVRMAREYGPELQDENGDEGGEWVAQFVLRNAARAHATHPDYRAEWAPTA